MTWFKVDDSFWGHPKQTALTKGSVALWVRAGSWSANLLTNGFVPTHMVAMLGGTTKDAKGLVDAGLWRSEGDGFHFHDWSDWQPTREQVHARRDAEAAKKASWRAKRAAQGAMSTTVSTGDIDVRPGGSPAPVPDVSTVSRPDPTRPDQVLKKTSSSGAPKRATQAPDDFEITDRMRKWASDNDVRVELERETQQFLDHHRAKGSTFKDWTLAWQTWMRNSIKFNNVRQLPGTDTREGKVRMKQLPSGRWSEVHPEDVLFGVHTEWRIPGT